MTDQAVLTLLGIVTFLIIMLKCIIKRIKVAIEATIILKIFINMPNFHVLSVKQYSLVPCFYYIKILLFRILWLFMCNKTWSKTPSLTAEKYSSVAG